MKVLLKWDFHFSIFIGLRNQTDFENSYQVATKARILKFGTTIVFELKEHFKLDFPISIIALL